MTTITLHATDAVLRLLDDAGIHYVLEDTAKALADERERLKKFRPGSPKYLRSQDRIARLEARAAESNATDEPMPTVKGVRSLVQSTQPRHTPAQHDAIVALASLQGIGVAQAEKIILQCTGSTAEELVTQALRKAS